VPDEHGLAAPLDGDCVALLNAAQIDLKAGHGKHVSSSLQGQPQMNPYSWHFSKV
jgi:hypothetical protein